MKAKVPLLNDLHNSFFHSCMCILVYVIVCASYDNGHRCYKDSNMFSLCIYNPFITASVYVSCAKTSDVLE